MIDHAEALSDDLLQVGPAPAHDAMDGPIRAGRDEFGQFGLLPGCEAGRIALGPAVLQAIRAALVETMDPVAQGLAVHAADPCCVGSAHPIQHGGQGQQAPALIGVLRPGRQPAKLIS